MSEFKNFTKTTVLGRIKFPKKKIKILNIPF
jgi:hypothetical protein